MRDYNFFSPYIATKRSYKEDLKAFYISAFVILAVSAVLYYGWNFYRIYNMEKEIAGMDSYLASEQIMKGVRTYEETKQRLKMLKDYQVIIEDVNKRIDSRDIIKRELMEKISSYLPLAVELHVVSVSADVLQLQGRSGSRTAVAEFVYNLKKTEAFQSVYVANISSENETGASFVFTISCALGGKGRNEGE
jgi:Tfp pilus assembly protein PilN